MRTSQTVGYVIFGKHDLRDPRKVLRLLISDPENLWSGKAREGNIGRIFRKLLFADHIVQVITFLPGSSIVPEKRRADHLIVFIQNHKPMHLPAKADARHLLLLTASQQLFQTVHGTGKPVLRLLFRPARMRKINGILFRDNFSDLAVPVHQKKLHRGCSKIDSDIKHVRSSFSDTHIVFLWIHISVLILSFLNMFFNTNIQILAAHY